MLDLLTKSDTCTTAVHDVPAVKKAKGALDAAQKGHAEIQQRVAELDHLCSPTLDTSNTHTASPNRLQALHAQAALPGVRLKLFEAEIALEAARASHEQAITMAALALLEARIDARKTLIVELFEVLHQAQGIAKEIEAYDRETTELGGKAPFAPCGEILSDQYRQSFVQGSEAVLKREGWL